MEASSILVIKVKYGNVLRRFNSQIVDGELKLNVDALRMKIVSLFNLDVDAELMITYIDEDGDVVTLVDDDDIRDVVKQALNPLRLTAKLCDRKKSIQDTSSSGSSTLLRSPRVETSEQNTNIDVSGLLRNLPEPARELLVHIASNLANLASAASSSAPGGAELVDYYIKLGLSYWDQHMESEPEATLLNSQNVNVMPSMQNTNTGFSVLLRKVPESLREMVVSLAHLAAGASSSASGGTKLEDYMKKLILFYLDQSLESQALLGVESSTQSGVPGSAAAAETQDLELTRDDSAAALKTLLNLRSEVSSKSSKRMDKQKSVAVMENKETNVPSVTGAHMKNSFFNFNAEAASFDSSNMNATWQHDYTLLNAAPAPAQSNSGVCNIVGNKEKAKKVIESYSNGQSHLPAHEPPASSSVGKTVGSFVTYSDLPSTANNAATGVGLEFNKLNEPKLESGHTSASVSVPKSGWFVDVKETSALPDGLGSGHANAGVSDPESGWYVDVKETSALLDGFRIPPASMWAPSSINECPFSGIDVGNVPAPPPQTASVEGPFRRGTSQNDDSQNIIHRGVRCDVCGIHPIVGPRFKSKVKVNYDLCSTCFGVIGNGSDFIRMEFPMAYRSHVPFKGLPIAHARNRRTNLPQVYRGCKVKSVPAKLNSCFIEDVNVIDGTVMPPSTPFTKIWRMRNNGAFGWPQGTQLIWIGGDKLSSMLSVELEIPAGAVWMNQELDIAVDFISPNLPGRYISYWRMATPSGHKFGQRVWVLIQVDDSLNDTPLENLRNFNLNLPPVTSSSGPEIINLNPEPMGGYNHPEFANSKKVEELLQPNSEQELKFPINDTLLVGNGPSISAPESVSYPIIDLSDVTPALSSVPPLLYPLPPPTLHVPPVVSPVLSEVDLEKNQIEEKLLTELEEMGFKHLNLNKEVLRMNEYNLEHAVDDLCGVTEWDPMLEELEEMGFHDREMNKKLLKKNNGSIKRVVMDLVASEVK